MLKTPDPVDAWGYLAASAARSQMLALVCGVVAAVAVGLHAWNSYHGMPIYYIPLGGPGIAQPGIVPDTSAMEAASRCLQARYTFMPATVKTASITASATCGHSASLVASPHPPCVSDGGDATGTSVAGMAGAMITAAQAPCLAGRVLTML